MDYGCRHGQPHDPKIVYENNKVKWEICQICSKHWRWNKGYKSRVNNKEYLKVHIRSFAQPNGATKRIYKKIYKPEECIITL